MLFLNKRLFVGLLFWFTINAYATETGHILVISDPHLNRYAIHSMTFHPRFNTNINDLDQATFYRLLTITRNAIQTGTLPKPQLVIFLGDAVGHVRFLSTDAQQTEHTIFHALKQTFDPIPIVSIFGNNDAIENDYGPFETGENSPYRVAMTSGWQNGFLSSGVFCRSTSPSWPCLLRLNEHEGYFSMEIQPHFRLIGLNTVTYSPHSTPKNTGQLNWLAQELADAQTHQATVLIAMHIPPGRNIYNGHLFWRDDHRFLNLVRQYHTLIAGLFAAHTHHDEIKRIQNKDNETIAGLFLTPALSTSHGNAPALRIYDYQSNHEHSALVDYTTFVFDQSEQITLKPLYRFRQYYCTTPSEPLLKCLQQVTAEKIAQYYKTGNPNQRTDIEFPDEVMVHDQ